MIRPDVDKWGQTVDDLRRLALESPHPRTRERLLALLMIASKQSRTTRRAKRVGLSDETAPSWVHLYNQSGPQALTYKRTGGQAPFLHPSNSKRSSQPSRPSTRGIITCPEVDGR
jgi:hypothetical protein